MQISLDTSSAHVDELTALIALCALLGGRLPAAHRPSTTPIGSIQIEVTEPVGGLPPGAFETDRPAPPPPAEQAAGPLEAGSDDTSGADGPAQSPSTTLKTGPANVGELDADGIPWDERIHASTKTKTQEGRWTKRRKVDEVTYGQVYAELQELYANGTASVLPAGETGLAGLVAAPPPPPIDRPAPPPPPAQSAATEGNVQPTPGVEPATAPTAAGPTVAGNASGATRFADFGAFVSAVGSIKTPSIPYIELNTIAESVVGTGVGFKDMKNHPDRWEDFYGEACMKNGVVPE